MQRVATGQYDVTIADSLFLDSYLPQHKELSVAFDLTEKDARAWAVRPQDSELQQALNSYLNKNLLHKSVTEINLGDLPRMQEQNILRVITYQEPTNYFIDEGKLQGFEYDFIRKFAEENKMRVDMVIARTHQEMQDLLLQGKGDIIAASLPANSIRNEQIKLSEPYNYVTPVIVGHESDDGIYDIRGLEGRRIFLSAESPYRNMLEMISDRGINIEIVDTGPGVDTKETLQRVAMGIYDLTLVGGHQLKAEETGQPGIKGQFSLSEPVATVWAVRSSNTLLLAAVNDYLERQYRSKFYNLLYSQYFERPRNTSKSIFAQIAQLSPYDQIIREYAEEYDFDWRLIVAQMYQESQFNPEAVSHAGAEGLMQIMPDTAQFLGANDVYDPKNSIKAGVKYLGILRDRFENNLLLEDRIWFSLAAYNAGYNRVRRARNIARDMGLDSNRWFGNVEKAMFELAKPFKKEGEIVRNCRCGQTIAYVREIRTLYNNYVRLTQTLKIASNEIVKKLPHDI